MLALLLSKKAFGERDTHGKMGSKKGEDICEVRGE